MRIEEHAEHRSGALQDGGSVLGMKVEQGGRIGEDGRQTVIYALRTSQTARKPDPERGETDATVDNRR
tara:strand:+ start:460 stop:663 length:204 start_codon:yes stop_codon:yes gene_type:complete